jgi:hypothetical protein
MTVPDLRMRLGIWIALKISHPPFIGMNLTNGVSLASLSTRIGQSLDKTLFHLCILSQRSTSDLSEQPESYLGCQVPLLVPHDAFCPTA